MKKKIMRKILGCYRDLYHFSEKEVNRLRGLTRELDHRITILKDEGRELKTTVELQEVDIKNLKLLLEDVRVGSDIRKTRIEILQEKINELRKE